MVFFGQALFGLLLIEAVTFFFTVSVIGFLLTFCLWAAAAALGLLLVRKQGLSALRNFQSSPSQQIKSQDLEKGFYLLIAGLLFIFPGFISDIAGFALLLPATQHFAQKYQPRGMEMSGASPFSAPRPAQGDDVVEGVYEVVEDTPQDPRRIGEKS